ncbi:MAG: hypothetical protein ACRDWY_01945 [Actinomycetes bacterium]
MSDNSTRDRGHLTAETAADLQEGLLDARQTMAAQAHLLACPRCAAMTEHLAAVPALLRDAGDVGALPPDVSARIDQALGSAARAVPVTPIQREPRPPLGMRILQAAAVLVVLLAGVGIAVSSLQGNGSDAGNTAADSAGQAAKEGASEDAGYPVTASGRNWSAETVVEAVPDLVAGDFPALARTLRDTASGGGGDDSGAEKPQLSAAGGASRLAGGPPLADCVTALNDGPVTPVAVDIATWQGQPAAVIVLPTPDDPATLDTWVVEPDCSQADAKVLYFARVARP